MILVTGGAGFIGSALVKALNDAGHFNIIIVDRLRNADKWKNLRGLKFNEFIHADSLFSGNYEASLRGVDLIFHLGACSSTTETDVDYLMRNNVDYSKALWNLAIKNKASFLYASSAATYGDGEYGYSDNHEEQHRLRPLNPYGWSKQLFDTWVLSQTQTPPFWYGLKFFNVFGPNEYHKTHMTSVVYKAFHQIKNEGKAKLFKSYKSEYPHGGQRRDFVYVKDVTSMMLALEKSKSKEACGIYNIGSGQARSFAELVNAVFAALNLTPNIEFVEMPENIRGQYQYFTQADMSKFQKVVPGFTPKTLEENVKDYVQMHLDTKNPYLEC